MLWQPQLFFSDNSNKSLSNEEKLNKKAKHLQQFEVKRQRKESVTVTICKAWFRTVPLHCFGNKWALFGILLFCSSGEFIRWVYLRS